VPALQQELLDGLAFPGGGRRPERLHLLIRIEDFRR
jgi:hypothetical protein